MPTHTIIYNILSIGVPVAVMVMVVVAFMRGE